MYDFDKIVDRKGTSCLKYDQAVSRGYSPDILPLWIADMDFPTAPEILESLHKTVNHGIFGYSQSLDDYYQAAADWFTEYFDYTPDKKWLVKTPGVVFALAMAIRAFTEKGDCILIQTPVYYPFYEVIRNNDRKIIENPLVNINNHYEIDFADFENKIKDNNVKLFILCSPHNPVGRVWSCDELRRMGQVCEKYNVIIISDEIHCDFVFPGYRHTVFTNACPEVRDRVIICTSPSKTFNTAGLQISNLWIENPSMRHKLKSEIVSTGYTEFNIMGIEAEKAAYTNGRPWHEENWKYIRENFGFLREFLKNHIPQIKLIEPEGTYFAWLDCSGLGLDREKLNELIIGKAGLWLDSGHIFGKSSEQFQRVVMASPRKIIEQALTNLERAVKQEGD
ncbi:MAG: pyridoxal phosphate-dependent aminotransferase [Ruminococcus sp.]|nr:pyridoxal phosphate-dependent aminotransferase [Ruminococcus sp.]